MPEARLPLAYRHGFARRRLHPAHRHRRPGERRVGAARGARVRRARASGSRLPRADAVRLRDRGPPAAGHAARRGRSALADDRRGSADLLPVLVVGLPLRHGNRIYNMRWSSTAGGCSASCRSRTCRPTASSTSAASSRPATTGAAATIARRRPRGAVRARPAVRGRRTCPGLVLHVEICEDMWVPVPPSAEAALAGATVLANLSGSPITVGRPRTAACCAARQSARCLRGLRLRRRGRRASRPPTWPGTARR